MELVFQPNLTNGTEAAALIKELVLILKRLGTCSCEMETGALRVDANVSVHKPGDPFGIRTEVKNINSFRFISKAIDFEIQRQIEILQNGGVVSNETRAYDYNLKSTVFMRDKEVLQDYRFYPEPNLPQINLTDKAFNLEEIKQKLPLLPDAERTKLMETYSLPLDVADKLVNSDGLSEFFQQLASCAKADKLSICEFLFTTVQAELNARKLTFRNCDLSVALISELVDLFAFKEISELTACDILQILMNGDTRTCKQIVKEYNWYLIADHKVLEELCLQVMAKYSRVVQKYRKREKKRDMTTLLLALNEKANRRASIEDAELVFRKLIFDQDKDCNEAQSKLN